MQALSESVTLATQVVYLAAEVLLAAAFIGLFMYVFHQKLGWRFRFSATRIGRIAVYVLLMFLWVQWNVGTGWDTNWPWLIALTAVFLAFLLVFCRGRVLHKVFWLFILQVFYLVSRVAGTLVSVLMYATPQFPIEVMYQPLVTEAAALVVFGLVCLLLGKQKKRSTEMSTSAILIAASIPVLSCFVIYVWSTYGSLLLGVSQVTGPDDPQLLYSLAAVLAIAVINLVVFILYDYMLTRAEKDFDQQAQLQQAQLSQAHYNELRSLYRETRTWRHDYSNHLATLEGLATAGKSDELMLYLGELKGSLSKITMRVHTGSELVDVILSTKLATAEQLGIAVDMDISVNMGEVELSVVDATSLVGNLLDNAIEACEKVIEEGGQGAIRLNLSRNKDQLSLYLCNSTIGDIQVDDKGNLLTSKKSGDHGIGTKQVKSLVKKYKGHVNYHTENGQFETFVTLSL